MFVIETKAHSSEGAPLQGKLLALPTDITLEWKGLLGTNPLAYYKNP